MKIRNFYEERHKDNWKESFTPTTIRRGELFKKFIGTGKKVLDFGVGAQPFYRFYSEGNELHIVEISQNSLDNVDENEVEETYLFDCEDPWCFEDESFDVVVGGEIIEHLFDPNHFVAEAHRVLKKGGLFVGSTPNFFNYRRRLLVLLGIQDESPIDSQHIRFFNYSWLKKLLSSHFDNVYITSYSPIRYINIKLCGAFVWSCIKER